MDHFILRAAQLNILISPPATRPHTPIEKTSTASELQDLESMITSEGSTTDEGSEGIMDVSSEAEKLKKYESMISLKPDGHPEHDKVAREWDIAPIKLFEDGLSAREKRKDTRSAENEDSQPIESFKTADSRANRLDPQARAFQPVLQGLSELNEKYACSKTQQREDMKDQRFHPYGHRLSDETNVEYSKRFGFLREESKHLDPVTDWGFDSAADSRRSSTAKPDRLNPTALAFRPKEEVGITQESNGSSPMYTLGALRHQRGAVGQANGTGFEPEDLDGSEVVITINGVEYMAKLKLKGPGWDIVGF